MRQIVRLPSQLGAVIQTHRLGKGLTQTELARLAGTQQNLRPTNRPTYASSTELAVLPTNTSHHCHVCGHPWCTMQLSTRWTALALTL